MFKKGKLIESVQKSEGCYGKDKPERGNSKLPNNFFKATKAELFPSLVAFKGHLVSISFTRGQSEENLANMFSPTFLLPKLLLVPRKSVIILLGKML